MISEFPPQLIKARDSSRESIRKASAIIQDELEWYQEQLGEVEKKIEELKEHQERGKWRRYQQNLVSISSSLIPFSSSIEDLEERQSASEEDHRGL